MRVFCVTIKLSIITKVVDTCHINLFCILSIDVVSSETVKQFDLQTEDAHISILVTFTRRCGSVAWNCVDIQGVYINLRRNTHDWEEEGEEEDDRSHGLLLKSCGEILGGKVYIAFSSSSDGFCVKVVCYQLEHEKIIHFHPDDD